MIRARDIKLSKNTVYVFGDNLERRGLGGQARVARPFVEMGLAIGIPTKRKPEMGEDAFFADREDEIAAVEASFVKIRNAKYDGKKIVFFPNIGDGLAELPRRSPKIHAMIRDFIVRLSKNGI